MLASFCSFFKKPPSSEPLSLRLDDHCLVQVLSFLEIKEQAECRLLCKRDRDGITPTIQTLAIKSLMKGRSKATLDRLENDSRKYERISGRKFNPNDITALELSPDSIALASMSPTAVSFISSLIGEQFDTDSLNDGQLVKIIKHFPNLRRLEIWCDSDSVLTQIFDRVKQLECLDIWVSSPTDSLCTSIAKFQKLHHLDLGMSWGNSKPVHIGELAALKKLEKLRFSGFWIPQEELRVLRHLKLKHFDIQYCEITNFSAIPNFSKLEYLRFDRRGLSDEQMNSLCGHEHLQSLRIRCGYQKQGVSADVLKKLLKIKNLKFLEIDSEPIDIPVRCQERISRCWKGAVSALRSHPVEIGLLAGGIAIGWPYMGPVCTFALKTTGSLLGGFATACLAGRVSSSLTRIQPGEDPMNAAIRTINNGLGAVIVGGSLGTLVTWQLIDPLARKVFFSLGMHDS